VGFLLLLPALLTTCFFNVDRFGFDKDGYDKSGYGEMYCARTVVNQRTLRNSHRARKHRARTCHKVSTLLRYMAELCLLLAKCVVVAL
jgi:hypothetical protein